MAEFDTFDTFLVWFEDQKPEWQPVLSARIALRALPLDAEINQPQPVIPCYFKIH